MKIGEFVYSGFSVDILGVSVVEVDVDVVVVPVEGSLVFVTSIT